MATGKPPFSESDNQFAVLLKITTKQPDIPPHLSREGKDFLSQCFIQDPAARPDVAQLLLHPFVAHTTLPKHIADAAHRHSAAAVSTSSTTSTTDD
jgi:serine/threonine protein kinase